MKVHVGTSGYSYKEWKGSFYPEKLLPKDMLRSYAERLSTVEINNTFYHMPTKQVLTSWREQVGDDFVFALKAPQVMTHWKRLKNVNSEAEYLFKSSSILDRKLGPVLFQFPKSFSADRSVLGAFLALIPDSRLCAFEFRNASWNDGAILDLLRAKGCSLCIADADEDPANEIVSTANWGYLRLRRSDYTDADLSQWAEKILVQKWDRAFVFFKHVGDGAKGPELAMRFQALIKAKIEKAG